MEPEPWGPAAPQPIPGANRTATLSPAGREPRLCCEPPGLGTSSRMAGLQVAPGLSAQAPGAMPLLDEPSRWVGPHARPQAPVLLGLYPRTGWTQLFFRVRNPTDASDRGLCSAPQPSLYPPSSLAGVRWPPCTLTLWSDQARPLYHRRGLSGAHVSSGPQALVLLLRLPPAHVCRACRGGPASCLPIGDRSGCLDSH